MKSSGKNTSKVRKDIIPAEWLYHPAGINSGKTVFLQAHRKVRHLPEIIHFNLIYMKYLYLGLLGGVFLFVAMRAGAQIRMVDSTLKMGKAGYHVICNNRNPEKNELRVKLIGFENTARDMDFYIKGKVTREEIDDLNNDGYPELLLYIYSGDSSVDGTVYVFVSVENKSCAPFSLPDVMLDGKLRDGYQGHDEFTLLEGTLVQKFPIYKPGDPKNKPTGGNRIVQYRMVNSEGGGYKFKVLHTYETK